MGRTAPLILNHSQNFQKKALLLNKIEEVGCDDVDKDYKGDTADRATGFTEQWAPLGCTGLYWCKMCWAVKVVQVVQVIQVV